jgi:hypothetical protein
MIRSRIDDIPRRSREGIVPSRKPFFVTEVAKAWYAEYLASEASTKGLAIPEAGPYRGSMAAHRCDRELYYALKGTDASNPPTLADVWRMRLGQLVHDLIGPIVEQAYPGARHEVKVDYRAIGVPGSGHADMADDDETLLAEYKTINGFGFKMIASTFKGPAEGPKYGHVMQAAMSAAAQSGITKVVIAYFSLENISADLEDTVESDISRFAAEWHFTVEELQPLVDYEVARIKRVMRMVEMDMLPERELHDPEYPAGAVVQTPHKQRNRTLWTVVGADGESVSDSGKFWGCGYCRWLDQCNQDGAGAPGVEVDI